jgi:hypothetical protein
MSVEVVTPAYKTKLGNASAKLVLVLLAEHANDEGFCFPSVEYIADRTELSVRQVLRVIQVFRNIGLVVKYKATGEHYDYYFVISLEKLGVDISTQVRDGFLRVRNEKCPTDSVPRTRITVPRTVPPTPPNKEEPSVEPRAEIKSVYDYYISKTGRNPKLYAFSQARKEKLTTRFQECLKKTDNNPMKAAELMKLSIDGCLANKWWSEKGLNDLVAHIFKSYEQMEKWWND